MVQGGRREEGSGWGPRVYLWQIHVDIWQNQYNIVKLKNKIKFKKRKHIKIVNHTKSKFRYFFIVDSMSSSSLDNIYLAALGLSCGKWDLVP